MHSIKPTTITEVKSVEGFEIRVVSLDLFTSVTVSASLMDRMGTSVGTRIFTFSGQDYAGWNNDDMYLVRLVASRLGFELKTA